MKYFVLGSNGFIGSNISKTLKQLNLNVVELNKEKFDIANKNDYIKYDFSNSIIIDSIASIDSNKSELFRVNVDGLKMFIDYLNLNCKGFKYIYISTTSTQIKEQVGSSEYVKSKFLAEKYIQENLNDYKIIRLIFPFGKGEKPNRLISRLISKIKQNEQLLIGNVTLNLTPIDLFNESIIDLISSNDKEINFTDGKVYRLKEIVEYLYELLKLEPKFSFDENNIVKLELIRNEIVKDYSNIKNKLKDCYE